MPASTPMNSLAAVNPAWELVLVVKHASNPIVTGGAPCNGLLTDADGTADLTMADGTVVTAVPLQKGYNPLRVTHIGTAGTAGAIYALYPEE